MIFGNAMLVKMQQEFPDKVFRLSKKGAVNYQTSSGRWLACCIHGTQVAACRKPGCENGDFCGCRGERGAQLVRSVCPKHNGASICQHGNRKNMCKVPPCFGNLLCATCKTQKSKCLCGTGGHMCDCGCGKRRGLCAKAMAQKAAGELPARVTKEYLEEKKQNFKSEAERKAFYDAKALQKIYEKCRRDADTGCLFYNARAADARGRVMAISMYDGESAAHRIVYRIEVNQDLQDADWVEHTCDNSDCVEKTHLKRKKRNDDGPEYFERRWQEILAAGKCDGECLLWTQYIDQNGYGRAKVNGDSLFVHRAAFMMANNLKEIPAGLQVRHKHTGNRHCYEISHLCLGTAEENGQDRVDHGTTAVGEKNQFARLTDNEALEIYELYSESASALQVAHQYGVSASVVKGVWFKGTYSTATGQIETRTAVRTQERAKRKALAQSRDGNITAEQYADAALRIQQRVTVDPVRGCWIVAGGTPKTYASISIAGRMTFCHCVMFEAKKNKCQPVEDGLYVLHTCEERGYDHYKCCNPDHLKKGTAKDNAIDHVMADVENVMRIKRIKRDVAAGMKPKDAAQKYGKSQSAIYGIINNVYYSYLSPAEDSDNAEENDVQKSKSNDNDDNDDEPLEDNVDDSDGYGNDNDNVEDGDENDNNNVDNSDVNDNDGND